VLRALQKRAGGGGASSVSFDAFAATVLARGAAVALDSALIRACEVVFSVFARDDRGGVAVRELGAALATCCAPSEDALPDALFALYGSVSGATLEERTVWGGDLCAFFRSIALFHHASTISLPLPAATAATAAAIDEEAVRCANGVARRVAQHCLDCAGHGAARGFVAYDTFMAWWKTRRVREFEARTHWGEDAAPQQRSLLRVAPLRPPGLGAAFAPSWARLALAGSAMLAVIIASSLGHGATMRHMTSRALRGVLEHVEGAERRAAGRLHGAIASGRELEPDLEALADLIVAEEAADRGLEVVSADLAASRDGASAAKLIAMGDTLKSAKLMAEGDVKAMVYRIEEDVEAASRSSRSGGGKKVPLKLMQQVASAGDALASLDNEADVFATVASSVAAKAAAPGATSAEKALADKDLRAVAESIEAVVVAKQKTVKRLVAAAKRAGN
jgi:hypothetical protein